MTNLKLFNALLNPAVIIDKSGEIQFVNNAWSEYGVNRDGTDEFIGRNYLDACTTTKSAETLKIALQEVLDGDRDSFSMEYPCHSVDVRDWYRVNCSKLDTDEDYFLLHHINITDQKIAEAELSRIQSFSTSHTQYLNHEVRNKMAIVTGHISQIEDEIVDTHPEVVDKHIIPIKTASDEVVQVLKNHMPESPLFRDTYKNETDLDTIALQLKQKFESDSVTITSNLSGNFLIDPLQFTHLLENLILNSIHHSDGFTKITLGLTDDKHSIYVQDNGPGFDETGIFTEVYTQLPIQGEGVGLKVVNRIIQNHEWDAVIENTDEGGRVTISGLVPIEDN